LFSRYEHAGLTRGLQGEQCNRHNWGCQ
jgi:hypothetical protein